MNYVIEFDIAAIFIYLIVIIFYYQRRNLPLLQNHAYIMFIYSAFFCTICDLGTTLLRGNSFPSWFLWGFHMIYFFSSNILSVIYTVYCASLFNFLEKLSNKRRRSFVLLIILPYAFAMLPIILSPLSYLVFGKPLAFYIDSSGLYQRGGFFFYILYFVVAYYTVISVSMIIKKRKTLSRLKLLSLFSYIVLMLVSVLIQLFHPRYLVQCFGISLATIMFSSIVQNPEEYVERATNLFNEHALIKMTSRDFFTGSPFLCVSVILDDITFISNAFGITQMNSFLSEVAVFLKKTFPHAYHYYLSQGKFCLIFRNYDEREIDRIKFELRVRFHENWVYDTLELKLYSRICIIESPKDVKMPEDILDLIDLVSEDTRYKQATIYARDIDTEYKRRTTYISHLLRRALAEKRFDVYYQPIYSTKEDRLIGAEALIRMKDENGDFVSPEEFIPIAEKTGDILRIGQFVFDSVCTTLSRINLEEYGIRKIDINLSVAQCMQEILAENILTIRTIHNIPASVINLEITETAAAYTPEILLKNMTALSEAGFELSLDDYGSGYSNMTYLITLPFKMVKIDKNIVWSAFNDAKSNTALASTITMIKRLGMKALAEGVETEEQARWLKSLGCDYLQGFYYAKGLPKEEFFALMKKDLERYKKDQENKNEYLKELDSPDIDERFEDFEDEETIEEIEEIDEIEAVDEAENVSDVEELEDL